jgi:glyoxylase-like metal-dependent hydrolase (beta-lactamase superfamily II)
VIERADLLRHRARATAEAAIVLFRLSGVGTFSAAACEELRSWPVPILYAVTGTHEHSVATNVANLALLGPLDAEAARQVHNDDQLIIMPVKNTDTETLCNVVVLPNAARWFDIEAVADGVYSIAEPGHREYVRSYLIEGERRALLIDTGTGIGDMRAEVETLTNLPVSVALTHTHWDHIGGASQFGQVAVFGHPGELERLTKGYPCGSSQLSQLVQSNFRLKRIHRPLPLATQLDTYEIPGVENVQLLNDGDQVDLGGRRLDVLHTPGHSPGSISFFDEASRLLFVGDVFYWGPLFGKPGEFNFDAYCRTADRLAALAVRVDRVFPGHNELALDGRAMGSDDLLHLRDGLGAVARGDLEPYRSRLFIYSPGLFEVEMPG